MQKKIFFVFIAAVLSYAYEPIKCEELKKWKNVDKAVALSVDDVVKHPKQYTCGLELNTNGIRYIFVYRNKIEDYKLAMFTYEEGRDNAAWANYYFRQNFVYQRELYTEKGHRESMFCNSGEFKKLLHKHQDEM